MVSRVQEKLEVRSADDVRRTVTLRRGLSMRIAAVVADESLGYRDDEDFILESVRLRLERVEYTQVRAGPEGRR